MIRVINRISYEPELVEIVDLDVTAGYVDGRNCQKLAT